MGTGVLADAGEASDAAVEESTPVGLAGSLEARWVVPRARVVHCLAQNEWVVCMRALCHVWCMPVAMYHSYALSKWFLGRRRCTLLT